LRLQNSWREQGASPQYPLGDLTTTTTRSMSGMNEQDGGSTSISISPAGTNNLSGATSDLIQSTLDPCVILMKQIVSRHAHQWEHDPNGIYSLAQGVVYWEPPRHAQAAILDELQASTNDLHKYCPDEGLPELVAALQTKLAKENGLESTNVMVTSGANQAYMNCVLTFLGEGEKCIVFAPYYFNHVMAIQSTRGNDAVLVGPIDDNGYPDLNWLQETLDSDEDDLIRMVTVVNPGNPTGVSLPRAVLDEVADMTRLHNEKSVDKKRTWLIMDNTYEHFDHPKCNTLQQDKDGNGFHCSNADHVVHIFSFSKGYAMAGYRVGYIALSNEGEFSKEAYQQMLKVQDTIPICTTRISQVAALGALSAGRSWVIDKVATLEIGRRAILSALEPLERVIGGSGAMYVMGKLPDGMDDQEIAERLVKEYGIAIIPGSFCGKPGWIRVCYSNLPPIECKIAAERLSNGISDICLGGVK